MVSRVRCEGPINGKNVQAPSAVPKIPSPSQVLRRSLTSTSGAQTKTRTPPKLKIELTVAIRSTGTPVFASRNGRGVAFEPTVIPEGSISRKKSQGAGH